MDVIQIDKSNNVYTYMHMCVYIYIYIERERYHLNARAASSEAVWYVQAKHELVKKSLDLVGVLVGVLIETTFGCRCV